MLIARIIIAEIIITLGKMILEKVEEKKSSD